MIPEATYAEAFASLRRYDVEGVRQAYDHFGQAAVHTAGAVPAVAGWAEACAHVARQSRVRGQAWEEQARHAVTLAESAVQRSPDFADAHRSLAVALAAFPDQAERRRAAAARAAELGPEEPANWYERWKAFGSRLDDEAIRRTLELDPCHFGAVHDLGVALSEEDRHDAAVRLLQTAVDLNPNSAQARCNLATVLARAGRHEESQAVLREAAELHPSDPLVARLEETGRNDHGH